MTAPCDYGDVGHPRCPSVHGLPSSALGLNLALEGDGSVLIVGSPYKGFRYVACWREGVTMKLRPFDRRRYPFVDSASFSSLLPSRMVSNGEMDNREFFILKTEKIVVRS